MTEDSMDSSDSQKKRPKRSSGALGLVLAQLDSEGGFSPEKRSGAGGADLRMPGSPAVQSDRFYPTKGLGRVPASVCRPWALADRPDGEFGHQAAVAQSLQSEGQIQPAVVRVLRDAIHPELRYEVIAGQVRWRAAKEAGVELDILVRDLSDEAAFRVMVGENEFRQNLSDYARGLRLKRALEVGLYKDKSSMAQACGLSASSLSYLLGFAELDPAVVARFSDPTKISARLGYVLNSAVRSGFRAQLLRDLSKIESGEIARDSIPGVWDNVSEAKAEVQVVQAARGTFTAPVQYRDAAGRVLFTVKQSSSAGPTLRFPKDMSDQMDEGFWEQLRAFVDSKVGHSDGVD